MIEFVQINMKKAFVAAVELNKMVSSIKDYITLATETYNFKGKVRSVPTRAGIICHENPRAAIFSSVGIKIVKLLLGTVQ